MAEPFDIACHEWMSLDFRFGSTTEVQRGPWNVRSWGQSGLRFPATACLLVAISGSHRQAVGSFLGRVGGRSSHLWQGEGDG